MNTLSDDTQQKMLTAPFAEVLALMMNRPKSSLLNSAAYNLQMASNCAGQEAFIEQMLLPYLEENIVRELPVYSSGGRAQTGEVLNNLLCQYEEDLGITFNGDQEAGAMKISFLFCFAVCHLKDKSLNDGLGIRKIGLFRPRWVSQ